MSFVHLHTHTVYSLLDGFSNVKKLVKRASEMDMPALAITDHGTMYGVIEFYNAARAEGIKPIIGMETYMAARRMTDRDSKLDKRSSHLLLLAENQTGYQNLLKLASKAQTDGFYYYPRIDHELLAEHAEGLICTSGCMSAEIPRALLKEDPDEAVRRMNWYYDIFGPDNFFVELQEHNIKEITDLNKKLVELGARYSAKYVATNDVHYINEGDARYQDILLAIQTGAKLADDDRMKMTDSSYYLRSPQEMSRLFAEIPEAVSNTLLIAERAKVNLDFTEYHLPKFPVPDGYTAETYLRHLCEQGLRRRYGDKASLPHIRERLEYELGIIHNMGFDAYFLIVWDMCDYARKHGIWYNARGSAAGSIVAYTLDITMVDPIHHNLLFERFLNPGRVSMPDIDLDFRDDRRTEMMEYTAKKYGDDKVAQIITFGTMAARGALRDVARVMDIPIPEVDKIAKLVPNIPGKPVSLSEALEQIPDLKTAYNDDPKVKTLVDTAIHMEGVVRNAGTHAAGVVIADKPLVEYLPLHRPTSGAEETPIKTVTQFEMGILDSLGMLKVDFLGLSTLTVMARACDMIKERHGVELNLDTIPVDDKESYELLARGQTAGVFQLEGTGMTRWVVEMKPRNLDNIIAMVALYRPGPMDFIPKYIARMYGQEKVVYEHPLMEAIFSDTFGIPIYQEQIMRAVVDLAGYTPSESDDLRKAISKKKADKIAEHKQKFVQGVVDKGTMPRETAEAIFTGWEEFARYGFNKSHAADYGVIAIQTAYLKAHYPAEYMSALMSVYRQDTNRVALYVSDTRSMGINVLPPDVNYSKFDFNIEEKDGQTAIRYGMGAVKNVGQGPVELILKARTENGGDQPFDDINDFARRVDLRAAGKRAIESLIKVGALDSFGERGALLASLDRITSASASHFRAAEAGQMSLFGAATGVTAEIVTLPDEAPVIDRKELLNWERDLIGLYISDHPLSPYHQTFSRIVSYFSGDLNQANHEEKVRVAGLVTTVRPHQTKNGKSMGFVTIEDIQGIIELVLFPRTWAASRELCEEGKIIIVEGKVDAQGNNPKILVDAIKTEMDLLEPLNKPDKLATPPASIPDTRSAPKKQAASPAPSTEVQTPPLQTRPQPRVQEAPAAYQIPDEVIPDWDDDDGPPPPDAFPPGWDEAMPEPYEHAADAEVDVAAPVPEKQPVVAAPQQAETVDAKPPVGALPPLSVVSELEVEPNRPPKQIVITIRPNGDPERDRRRIKHIYGILISYPGKDKFSLQIWEGGRGYLLDFPSDSTRINPEMLDRLKKLIPETSWRIEEITYQ